MCHNEYRLQSERGIKKKYVLECGTNIKELAQLEIITKQIV